MLRRPTDIFDLSSLRRKPVKALNEILGPSVEKSFPRERALPRRAVSELDGAILSQYARLYTIGSVVVRTANVELVSWFSAGLDTSPAVYVDPRIRKLLDGAPAEALSQWSIAGTTDETLASGGVTAVLADRADIIEFSEAICADVASDRRQVLVLHDVLDIASRELCRAANEAGIALHVVPGHRAFAVFQLEPSESEARSQLVALIRSYACSVGEAPEHLAPRARKEDGVAVLLDAIDTSTGQTDDGDKEVEPTAGDRSDHLLAGNGQRSQSSSACPGSHSEPDYRHRFDACHGVV